MAVIWQKKINNTLYEVRTAGKTRRLYSNGVFHSQYRPQYRLLGGVWDLLILPAFFYKAKEIQRVLVLGVGGGAVIHHLHRNFQIDEIVGVELNPVHIKLAKKYFGITPQLATLYQADAAIWLENYQGSAFDLIIDDVFGEIEGEPVRAISADSQWFSLLEKNVVKNGLLVINFVNKKELKSCAYFHSKNIKNRFTHAFQYNLPLFENAVAAFIKKQVSAAALRQTVYQRLRVNKNIFPYTSQTLNKTSK